MPQNEVKKKGMHLNMLALISGMNWTNTANAGVWSFNSNNNRTNSNNNVSLSADSNPPDISNEKTGYEGDAFLPRACRRNRGGMSFLVAFAKTKI